MKRLDVRPDIEAERQNRGKAAINRASSTAFSSIRTSPSANRVYDSLVHAIVTGRFARGQRLPSEFDLAARFEVSRPILRQALERLRAEGLITSVRGSGSYVNSETLPASEIAPSPEDVMEHIDHILNGLEFRRLIEPEAAGLAAARRTPKDIESMRAAVDAFELSISSGEIGQHYDYLFHEAIASATANPRIVSALRSLEYDVSHSVNLMRHLARYQPLDRSARVIAEHRLILQCIEEGAEEGARRAMRTHLEHARIRMMNRKTDA